MLKCVLGLLVCVLLLAPVAIAEGIAVGEDDWPWWRGPTRDGVAKAGQAIPQSWGEDEHVLWKAKVPGRGHASPTVVGDRVFLASADEGNGTQWVLAYDRNTGAEVWRTVVHEKAFSAGAHQGHPRATKASCTVASDGERLFVNFIGDDKVFTSALDMDGKILWQHKLTDYVIHQGYGSSPAIYDALVIAGADNKGGGVITAFDRVTGDAVWSVKRRALPNYPSPIILPIAGKDQLIMPGHESHREL